MTLRPLRRLALTQSDTGRTLNRRFQEFRSKLYISRTSNEIDWQRSVCKAVLAYVQWDLLVPLP